MYFYMEKACVLYIIVLQVTYLNVNAVPTSLIDTTKQQLHSNEPDEFYDQRQNGTENLRIHLNDITVVVAPSEGILQLMSASGADYLGSNNEGSSSGSNKPSSNNNSFDCASSDTIAKCKQQSHKKHRIRLSNLLFPLLGKATSSAKK